MWWQNTGEACGAGFCAYSSLKFGKCNIIYIWDLINNIFLRNKSRKYNSWMNQELTPHIDVFNSA